jgi:hypothetical protein
MTTTQDSIPLELGESPVLDVEADAIRLEVLPVESGSQPRVEVDSRGHSNRRTSPVTVDRSGEVVRVRIRTSWVDLPFAGEDVIKRIRLFVPQHVRAKLSSSMGRVRVERLAGCDLDISTAAGAVELEEVRGRLSVSVDSGSVRGSHLGGTFNVRSQAGSVRLSIDALDAGTHLIRTSMGSVKVELARGLVVRVETSATLGSARSNYPSTPGAEAVLRLEAELGSVKVRESGSTEDPRHGDWPDWRRFWHDVVGSVAEQIAPRPPRSKVTDAELREVLDLVQNGKISATDAERLIRAMGV